MIIAIKTNLSGSLFSAVKEIKQDVKSTFGEYEMINFKPHVSLLSFLSNDGSEPVIFNLFKSLKNKLKRVQAETVVFDSFFHESNNTYTIYLKVLQSEVLTSAQITIRDVTKARIDKRFGPRKFKLVDTFHITICSSVPEQVVSQIVFFLNSKYSAVENISFMVDTLTCSSFDEAGNFLNQVTINLDHDPPGFVNGDQFEIQY
ncbi:MAG TPA: hypothetical protein VK177_20575 [Flavobacteriales bacterium]|nr:hypothetical protein [Flavobacteriales bacterium]